MPTARRTPRGAAPKRPAPYRHFFFDLDGTVTRSRTPITEEMHKALTALMAAGGDVIIVSGAQAARGREQTGNLPCYFLGQNGNHAVDNKAGRDIWKRVLSPSQKRAILDHIARVPRDYPVVDEQDLIEDRGCQISYSLIGHHRPIEEKEACDPKHERRLAILRDIPLTDESVEVKSAGTTCLDYFARGQHKGFNIAELIAARGWQQTECVYLGDALFPGGNDETVVGVIDTHEVSGPDDTLAFVQKYLATRR